MASSRHEEGERAGGVAGRRSVSVALAVHRTAQHAARAAKGVRERVAGEQQSHTQHTLARFRRKRGALLCISQPLPLGGWRAGFAWHRMDSLSGAFGQLVKAHARAVQTQDQVPLPAPQQATARNDCPPLPRCVARIRWRPERIARDEQARGG